MKEVYYVVWDINKDGKKSALRSKCGTVEAAKEKLDGLYSRLCVMKGSVNSFKNKSNTEAFVLFRTSEGEVRHEFSIAAGYTEE